MSDRMKREHKFWFALFHEAMHILLHSKRALFIDFTNAKSESNSSEEEREADQRAADHLLTPEELKAFLQKYTHKPGGISEQSIKSFSKELGISPSLLFVRLQFERRIPWASTMTSAFKDELSFE